MEYREFVCAAIETMNQKEGKNGIQAREHRAVKNNGKIRVGLLLQETGSNLFPTIYLEEYYEKFQKGETLEVDGKTLTPDMVLGPDRKGIKVTYCTDTRPTPAITENAKHSDLFICEGMYAEKEKEAKARQYKHMTFYEAAKIASAAEVSEMWLTHFSPSLVHAENYMGAVQRIFPNAQLGKDGRSVELDFLED